MRPYLSSKIAQTAKYLLFGLALLYAADWSIFQVRLMRGTGMGTIPVEQYLVQQMKGNKAEYDYLGTQDKNCSRAMFPQYAGWQWNPPCWWLQRHRQRWG